MMKALLLILLSGSVVTAHAVTVVPMGLPIVMCQSTEKIEGWDGSNTKDFLEFAAYLDFDGTLSKAIVTGAYRSDSRDLQIDPQYRPKAKTYQNFNRYTPLEDAWHFFYAMMPKDLGAQPAFKAYVAVFSEQGFVKTLPINCTLSIR